MCSKEHRDHRAFEIVTVVHSKFTRIRKYENSKFEYKRFRSWETRFSSWFMAGDSRPIHRVWMVTGGFGSLWFRVRSKSTNCIIIFPGWQLEASLTRRVTNLTVQVEFDLFKVFSKVFSFPVEKEPGDKVCYKLQVYLQLNSVNSFDLKYEQVQVDSCLQLRLDLVNRDLQFVHRVDGIDHRRWSCNVYRLTDLLIEPFHLNVFNENENFNCIRLLRMVASNCASQTFFRSTGLKNARLIWFANLIGHVNQSDWIDKSNCRLVKKATLFKRLASNQFRLNFVFGLATSTKRSQFILDSRLVSKLKRYGSGSITSG